MAEAGGGEYADASDGDDLRGYFAGLIDQRRGLAELLTCTGSAAREAGLCRRAFYREAASAMASERNAARRRGDDARADAVAAIMSRASAASEREGDEALAVRDERVEEIRAQLEEIDELERRLERGR